MSTDYRTCARKGESEIIEKKSRFLGDVVRVSSLEEAEAYIAAVRKRHYDARHHCFAFIVGEPGTPGEILRSSDDGEPQGTAGKPMLEILTGRGLHNVLVVVTRYFGGTLLGTGGLVRAYSAAAKAAAEDAGTVLIRRGVRMSLHCSYPLYGKFQYLFSGEGIQIAETQFSDDVEMHLIVPTPDIPRIQKLITEQTGGAAKGEILEEITYEEAVD